MQSKDASAIFENFDFTLEYIEVTFCSSRYQTEYSPYILRILTGL